ncbi:ATP-dependent helicase HrpB [Shewanella avicenniae]|uniref:ATP-dependent helicase HrpB n=1 Tax=Shewanella avicenniae TaxID=2814294 RepID=A0ABX7QQD1_9GAMM|nr:ATP-dependent helicase HrpB [Shewanella avicenniae]QSX33073.1 ATP-dependent helicase HrpB [Shewanella avicenniae]
MNHLPIQALLPALRQALPSQRQLIIEAPTGAGKSTALPYAMLDWPEIAGRILLLEPRRVAARSIASFLAKQRQQSLGDEVGYRVRGESRVGRTTKLEIITEGILTRMIQQDPSLDGVAMIIFDEIHERHLSTDLGLALALEVQQSLRDDLTIVAMSATLQGLPLASLMPNALKLVSEGRSFPVTIAYQAPKPLAGQSHLPDWLLHMGRMITSLMQADTALTLGASAEQAAGSLLAFLPGKREILQLAEYLTGRLGEQVKIFPLYGELNAAEQDAAIAPAVAGQQKVVLSTNLAESSLTIEGITMVVDSGYKRQASFNPKTAVTRLSLKRISQASATQRCGRAGRLSAGFCLRLWSAEEQERLLSADEPEIVTSDLLGVAFEAANWGVKSISELMLLTPPNAANEMVAWQLLQSLELVDGQRNITAIGRQAYGLGASVRLAHMLVKAQALATSRQQPQLLGLACLLAALLDANVSGASCDIQRSLANATTGLAGRLCRNWLQKFNISQAPAELLRAANSYDVAMLLAFAFPDRIAKARGQQGFLLANGTGVELAQDEALNQADWLVVADFQEQQGRSAGRVWLACELPIALFSQELNYLCQWQEIAQWDEARGRMQAEKQLRLGKLVLKTEVMPLSDVLRIAGFIDYVSRKGLTVLNIDDSVRQLQYRLTIARSIDQSFNDFNDAWLLDNLVTWLAPYLTEVRNVTQLKALDITHILLNTLEWSQRQQLAQWLPERWPMATGTHAPIRYDESGRALLSVRLQEALGMAQSPQLLNGTLGVTMELLSPAQRPLALTSDLASFWAGPYVEVKKEMRGRYPKHLWPDDPANTQPTKFTKKRTLNQ